MDLLEFVQEGDYEDWITHCISRLKDSSRFSIIQINAKHEPLLTSKLHYLRKQLRKNGIEVEAYFSFPNNIYYVVSSGEPEPYVKNIKVDLDTPGYVFY